MLRSWLSTVNVAVWEALGHIPKQYSNGIMEGSPCVGAWHREGEFFCFGGFQGSDKSMSTKLFTEHTQAKEESSKWVKI
jgi:hypothetical protein